MSKIRDELLQRCRVLAIYIQTNKSINQNKIYFIQIKRTYICDLVGDGWGSGILRLFFIFFYPLICHVNDNNDSKFCEHGDAGNELRKQNIYCVYFLVYTTILYSVHCVLVIVVSFLISEKN